MLTFIKSDSTFHNHPLFINPIPRCLLGATTALEGEAGANSTIWWDDIYYGLTILMVSPSTRILINNTLPLHFCLPNFQSWPIPTGRLPSNWSKALFFPISKVETCSNISFQYKIAISQQIHNNLKYKEANYLGKYTNTKEKLIVNQAWPHKYRKEILLPIKLIKFSFQHSLFYKNYSSVHF